MAAFPGQFALLLDRRGCASQFINAVELFVAAADASYRNAHSWAMFFLAFPVFCQNLTGIQVVFRIESADALVKAADKVTADIADVVCVQYGDKVIPADMADEIACRDRIRQEVRHELDHAIAVAKAIGIVVCLEVIQIDI